MRKSTPATEEVIGTELIENTIQLSRIPLSEGHVICETCGAKCREGSQVTAVTVRPNELSMWQTESAYCDDHAPSIEQHTTQARRTAVVSGRVGRVMDHAYQHEWRILLGAVLEAVSPSGTREVTDTQTLPLQNLLRVPEKNRGQNWWPPVFEKGYDA
jgi:hypothetical protein